MTTMTIEQLKRDIQGKLAEARKGLAGARDIVRRFEEQIVIYEDVLRKFEMVAVPERTSTRPAEKPKEAASPQSLKSNEDATVGREVKKLIDKTDGEFDTRGIIKVLQLSFPNLESAILSRRVSAVLYRFEKRGAISVVKRGTGSDPNVYRRAAK